MKKSRSIKAALLFCSASCQITTGAEESTHPYRLFRQSSQNARIRKRPDSINAMKQTDDDDIERVSQNNNYKNNGWNNQGNNGWNSWSKAHKYNCDDSSSSAKSSKKAKGSKSKSSKSKASKGKASKCAGSRPPTPPPAPTTEPLPVVTPDPTRRPTRRPVEPTRRVSRV